MPRITSVSNQIVPQSRKMSKSLIASTIFLICFLSKLACGRDEYLQESQQACERTKDFYDCAKVRVLKYVTGYTVPINDVNNSSFVKLVRMADEFDGSGEENVSSTARFVSEDSESVKFLKFIQRQANSFLTHQGLSIDIPQGARLIDSETGRDLVFEGRKKKIEKKAGLLIPILILFKLFKVKVLVALALAGIFFIKKVILIGALILPSLLHGLKTACKHHFVPHHIEEHHPDHGLLTGFGGGDYGGGGYYGGDEGKGGWERLYKHYRTK